MTRKQAIWKMWNGRIEMMGYRIGDHNELQIDDLQAVWALCFTSDNRKKFFRDAVKEVVDHVQAARACGEALWNTTGEPEALNHLMEEIEAFAKENKI